MDMKQLKNEPFNCLASFQLILQWKLIWRFLSISDFFLSPCKWRSILSECAETADSFSNFVSSLYLATEMFCWARLLFSSFPPLSCLLCCIQYISCIYLYLPFCTVNHVCPFILTSCLAVLFFCLLKFSFFFRKLFCLSFQSCYCKYEFVWMWAE